MKKITLIAAFLLTALQMNSQIAPGSVAPDFTATDINGNVHSLSAYLAAGKTVIMDVSATWCGPCWNYHNNHALDDMYNSYGPGGSDEVVVLFIEGDAATTNADLHGTGNNTQGDWVVNTPYPIIDGTNIGNLYQITYFPTVFRICPDGLVSEVGAVTAGALRTSINAACGPDLVGVQNHVQALDTENGICSTNGSPIAKFKNYGENVVTGATLNLKANGTVVGTKSFVGTAPRFTTRSVTFDALDIDPTADYTVEIVNANSGSIFNPALATADMGVALANQTTSDVVVNIYTDNYPEEITWKIKNGAGAVIASGGPYAGQGNTTITANASLPINDCYSVELGDTYGDGWNLGATPHGIEIFANDVSVYSFDTGTTGFTTLLKSNVLTTTTLAVNQVEAPKYGIYPNPSTGIVRINTLSTVQVDVIDALGKVVFHAADINGETSIDLSGLQKGIYIARIVGENTTSTEKIILN